MESSEGGILLLNMYLSEALVPDSDSEALVPDSDSKTLVPDSDLIEI